MSTTLTPTGMPERGEQRHGALGRGRAVEAAHRRVRLARAVVAHVHLREAAELARALRGVEAEAARRETGDEAARARVRRERAEIVPQDRLAAAERDGEDAGLGERAERARASRLAAGARRPDARRGSSPRSRRRSALVTARCTSSGGLAPRSAPSHTAAAVEAERARARAVERDERRGRLELDPCAPRLDATSAPSRVLLVVRRLAAPRGARPSRPVLPRPSSRRKGGEHGAADHRRGEERVDDAADARAVRAVALAHAAQCFARARDARGPSLEASLSSAGSMRSHPFEKTRRRRLRAPGTRRPARRARRAAARATLAARSTSRRRAPGRADEQRRTRSTKPK